MSLPTSIGICAPYTWGETTSLACSLGEYARRFGCPVDYLAFGTICDDVHDRWDGQIRSARRLGDFRQWALSHSHIVWFGVHPQQMVRASGLSNILVVLRNAVPAECAKVLPRFDHLVSPCADLAVLLQRRYRDSSVRHVLWDCGYRRCPSRDGLVAAGQMRLLVTLDSAMVSHDALSLLSVLRILLDQYAGLNITLMHCKRWRGPVSAMFDSLLRGFPGRVQFVRRPSVSRRVWEICEHDWVFCASLKSNAGWDALEALYLGVPVIVFDVSPYSEFVRAGYNGVTIPASVATVNWLGAGSVEVNTHMLLSGLTQAMADEHFLRRLQQRNWALLQQARVAFQGTWNGIWSDP